MKKIKRHNKINILILLCAAVLLFPSKVFAAQEENVGHLIIEYPVENVDFTFYKVAEFSEYGNFRLDYPFSLYENEIHELDILKNQTDDITTETWINLAKTLESYVSSKHISYDFIERTDENGQIICENLENGLYLILGEQSEKDGQSYTPAPVLMTLPNRDSSGQWTYEVSLDYSGKALEDIYDEYRVLKIWDDYGNENKRPRELEIELYKNEDGKSELYDTVILNETNNWEYTWTDLPKGCTWVVSEKRIPDNYKVKYQTEGADLLVVNTYSEPPTQGGKLPQTGQLWWPVPFLAIGGLAFIIVGLIRRNGEDY